MSSVETCFGSSWNKARYPFPSTTSQSVLCCFTLAHFSIFVHNMVRSRRLLMISLSKEWLPATSGNISQGCKTLTFDRAGQSCKTVFMNACNYVKECPTVYIIPYCVYNTVIIYSVHHWKSSSTVVGWQTVLEEMLVKKTNNYLIFDHILCLQNSQGQTGRVCQSPKSHLSQQSWQSKFVYPLYYFSVSVALPDMRPYLLQVNIMSAKFSSRTLSLVLLVYVTFERRGKKSYCRENNHICSISG